MASNYNLSDQFSSPAPRRKYDVFLSFRGKDTREVFAYNLYKAFIAKGLHTFRDDDEIEAGKEVNAELMKAIEESTCSVLIISVKYADSSWCLNELVKILNKTPRENVYPVFYHVNPSDVREQAGKFGEGFSEAVSKNQKNYERWKEALVEIAGLEEGVYPSPGYGTEAAFCEELALKIFIKLKDTYPYPLEGLVGMNSRMEKVINLLDLESSEARIVGLWGLGGSGKTTIARAVYDSISWKFKGCSFIENVSTFASRSGFSAIQEKIIFDTMNVKDMSGTNLIRQRVCHKKVLIVLDDVAGRSELDSLFGNHFWFSPGSRIIITTGNKNCLNALGAVVYEVQRLNNDESRELFRSNAFSQKKETKIFGPLIKRALLYANGFPLALKVLGSFLSDKTIRQWEAELNRLKKSPSDIVQEVLRLSYDGLNKEDQNIFLDICCFFRGKYKDDLINVLESSGFNPNIGVENLVQKSLLTISENNTVWMLNLVQKMGWTIVQEESAINLGKRSRLWHHDDIKSVLKDNIGTNRIQGIFDDYPDIGATDLEMKPEAFDKMINLRVLKISNTIRKSESPGLSKKSEIPTINLPNTLCYLYWHNYPLKCMPPTFKPKNIVELHLTNSVIEQLWKEMKVLPKLTVLDLSYSTSLINCPDFKNFPNLGKLILEGCTKLVKLHPSLKDLKKLTILNLKGCEKLKTIPRGIESQCLKILVFSGCLKLSKILENFVGLEQLSELFLDGTSITEVPNSISNSTGLYHLDLSRCKKLKNLPSSIGKLKKLKRLELRSCYRLKELPQEVGHIESLEILDVSWSGVKMLPSSVVHLRNLQALSLRNCNGYPFPSWMYSFLSIFLPTWTSNCMTFVLPSVSTFESLTSLDLGFCRLKSVPESISCCKSLRELILPINKFEYLPASIKDLNYLETLWLLKCKNLKEIPELPKTVRYLMASGCESLKTICNPSLLEDALLLCFSNCSQLVDNEERNTFMEYEFLLKQIKENDDDYFRVYTGPGSKIPKWFTNQNVGASIKFPLLSFHNNSSNLLGLALSVVISTKRKDSRIGVQIKVGGDVKDCWAFLFYKNVQDVYILYFPLEVFKVNGIYPRGMEFHVRLGRAEYDSNLWKFKVDKIEDLAPPEVKRCGARLIYEDDLDIIEYVEARSVKFEKLKICLFLFILNIVYLLFQSYIDRESSINLACIDAHWRKLDYDNPASEVDDAPDDFEHYLSDLRQCYESIVEPVRRQDLKNKIENIIDSTKITARPPVVKPRKQSKKQSNASGKAPGIMSTKRHPSAFELTQSHMDGTPMRHSFIGTRKTSKPSSLSKPMHSIHERGATSVLEPPLPKTKDVMKLHLQSFPKIFHQWIEFIHNTVPDGNCGFRAIAKGLGMNKDEEDWPLVRACMLKELELNKTYYLTVFDGTWGMDKYEKVKKGLEHWDGEANYECWFKTPEMGFLAASTYNICIVFLCSGGCISYVPLNKAPKRKPSVVWLGNVNKTHYVHIGVRQNPPIPTICNLWGKKRLEIAKSWPSLFKENFDLYTSILCPP